LRPGREEEMNIGEEKTFRHGKEFSNCEEVRPRRSSSLETAPPIRARPKLKAKQHDVAGASTSADPPPKKRKRVFQEILLEPVVNAAVLDDALKSLMEGFAQLIPTSAPITQPAAESTFQSALADMLNEAEAQQRKGKEPVILEEVAKKQQIAYNEFV
jgi:hypothetical protein